MITSVPNLWRIDIGQLEPPTSNRQRRIGQGPLLNLDVLKVLIASGQLNEDAVWQATKRCQNSLEDYGWSHDDVLQIFSCLLDGDYKNSEWCDVDGGRTVPCDVYKICYDEARRKRHACGLDVYLKFSIDDAGALTLVLVQSHFS